MKNEVEEEITETAETIETQQKNSTPKKKYLKQQCGQGNTRALYKFLTPN